MACSLAGWGRGAVGCRVGAWCQTECSYVVCCCSFANACVGESPCEVTVLCLRVGWTYIFLELRWTEKIGSQEKEKAALRALSA